MGGCGLLRTSVHASTKYVLDSGGACSVLAHVLLSLLGVLTFDLGHPQIGAFFTSEGCALSTRGRPTGLPPDSNIIERSTPRLRDAVGVSSQKLRSRHVHGHMPKQAGHLRFKTAVRWDREETRPQFERVHNDDRPLLDREPRCLASWPSRLGGDERY